MPSNTNGEFSGVPNTPPPPRGPFQQFLDIPAPVPRPIDQEQSPATGFESGPVAAGKIALDFLRGIRANRTSDYLENERNNQASLDNYRQYVNNRLQDPDLTDDAKQALLAEANSTMNQHMHFEMRDVPKDGVGGFFKNILTHLSGGPIKTREPIDWDQATGRLTNLTNQPGYNQKQNYQQALNEATQALDQLKASGQPVMPHQVEQTLAPILSKVAMTAPNYVNVFQSTMKGLVPGDPFQEAMEKAQLGMMQQWTGGASAPTTAPPPSAPAATAPPPSVTVRLGMGAGVPVQIPQAVSSPPPEVRPAELGAPVAQTAPPPAMDLRNPINRALMGKFGFKVGEPTTLYDPSNLTKFASGAILDPSSGRWMNYRTMQPLPQEMQGWVPHDQIKLPQVSQDVLASGADTEAGTPTLWVVPRNNPNSAVQVRPGGHPLYNPTPLEEVAGPAGATRVPRGQAVNRAVPLPLEQPDVAAARKRDTDALSLVGQARAQYPNDANKQREFVAAAAVSDAVRGKASEFIGDPRKASGVEEQMKALFGAPAGAPATPRTPAPPTSPAAPPSQRNRAK